MKYIFSRIKMINSKLRHFSGTFTHDICHFPQHFSHTITVQFTVFFPLIPLGIKLGKKPPKKQIIKVSAVPEGQSSFMLCSHKKNFYMAF